MGCGQVERAPVPRGHQAARAWRSVRFPPQPPGLYSCGVWGSTPQPPSKGESSRQRRSLGKCNNTTLLQILDAALGSLAGARARNAPRMQIFYAQSIDSASGSLADARAGNAPRLQILQARCIASALSRLLLLARGTRRDGRYVGCVAYSLPQMLDSALGSLASARAWNAPRLQILYAPCIASALGALRNVDSALGSLANARVWDAPRRQMWGCPSGDAPMGVAQWPCSREADVGMPPRGCPSGAAPMEMALWGCRNGDAPMGMPQWGGSSGDAPMRMPQWGCPNGDAPVGMAQWGCPNPVGSAQWECPNVQWAGCVAGTPQVLLAAAPEARVPGPI